jgi:hypothetical protein
VKASNGHDPERLEHEVEDIRSNIDHIVIELDRRRHELFDWRLQLRRHGVALGALAAAFVVATAGSIGFAIWRSRRRARPLAKAKRWRAAFSRVVEHPEWVAREHPSVGNRALVAAASAVAGVVAKRTALRLTDGWEAPRSSSVLVEPTKTEFVIR